MPVAGNPGAGMFEQAFWGGIFGAGIFPAVIINPIILYDIIFPETIKKQYKKYQTESTVYCIQKKRKNYDQINCQ